MALRNDTTSRELIIWTLLNATRVGILLVLFMPLVVTSSTLFPFIVGKAIYARSIIEVAFGLWLMLVLVAPEHRPKRSWILIAFGVWLVASVVAGFAGVSLQRSMWSTYERMQGIVDLAHWTAFVLVAGSVFRTIKNWKWLFSVNLGVSLFASILGLGHNFNILDSGILGTDARIESTLGNATYVGAYTMVNILVALGLIALSWRQSDSSQPQETSRAAASRAGRRRRRRASRQSQGTNFDWLPFARAFWLTAVVLELWTLWLTETRGALIGLGAGAVVFASVYSLWGKIEQVKKVSYAIMGMVIAALLLFILARSTSVLDPVIDRSPTLSRVATIGLNDDSIKGRITSISAGLQGYIEKPVFGWGPENYLIAWGRHFDADSGVRERFDQAHNKLVEELTTKGAVGLVTYLSIWAAMIWVFVRALRRREGAEQAFVILIGSALAAFFVQNMFLFDSPVTVLQFAVLVSFFVAEEMQQRQTQLDSADDEGRSQPPASSRINVGERLSVLFSSPVGGTISALILAVLLGFSIYFLNIKPFNAAATIVQTSDPNITWIQRFGLFEQAIDEFPALANYPRLLLLSQVSNNLSTLTTEELEAAVALIEKEGAQGLIDEPEGWRIHVAMAHFYQTVALLDVSQQEILDRAREHVEKADKLAPRTVEVNAIRSEQERLEGLAAGQ